MSPPGPPDHDPLAIVIAQMTDYLSQWDQGTSEIPVPRGQYIKWMVGLRQIQAAKALKPLHQKRLLGRATPKRRRM